MRTTEVNRDVLKVWFPYIPPQVQLPICKILRNALPLNSRKFCFVLQASPICVFCEAAEETTEPLSLSANLPVQFGLVFLWDLCFHFT